MALDTRNYTTGPATLLDVGRLSYNGCVFSPLYETKLSGKAIKDTANRTTKYMEYTLMADGYVTMPAGATSIGPTMTTLRKLLTAQGGSLSYQGRGFDLIVNGGIGVANLKQDNRLMDVAWGPVPELIEFQPLGGGRSAKVQWKVTTRIPEIAGKSPNLLQLTYGTTVSYGEDGFSSLAVKGTLEIPMTRFVDQADRTVPHTVDDYREILSKRILAGIDLSRFRVTRREFPTSDDKRTLTFDVAVEEKPYMDLPMDCTLARGTYNVRPAKVGMGLVLWLCTLKATYTVRNGAPRRTAWIHFLDLLRRRMKQSAFFDVPELKDAETSKKPNPLKQGGRALIGGLGGRLLAAAAGFNPIVGIGLGALAGILTSNAEPVQGGVQNAGRRCWLIDFNIDEGLYLDSKTVTFSATWRLNSHFKNILLSSGLWRKSPETDDKGNSLWAISMRSISGTRSWLENRLNPAADIIVDFGAEY